VAQPLNGEDSPISSWPLSARIFWRQKCRFSQAAFTGLQLHMSRLPEGKFMIRFFLSVNIIDYN
jgi:hypothetical protein